MKHFVLLMAPLLVACACTPPLPPPAPAPPITTAPPPAASAAPAPAPVVDALLVSVTAARRPPTLVLDGDIAEWGSLLPPSVKAPAPEPGRPPSFGERAMPDPDVPLPSGPNPASAASHLALALGTDAVTIAADLGQPAKDGFWLGIGAVPPRVPSVGLLARGGYIVPFDCDFEQIRMMEGEWAKGPAKPPEVVAACHGLIARHAELVAHHRARFSRLFKIDRDGVHGASAEGTLSSIEGAKAVFKPGPRGATVEVTLPLNALPRLVEAPVVTLRLVARAAIGPKPDVVSGQWVEVSLPEPVTFEPFGDLRNHSAELLSHTERITGFSYQPGDPGHVETMQHESELSHDSIVAREETLYSKPLARLGDIEIGYVSAYRPWLAVFKDGKFLREGKAPPGEDSYGGETSVDAFSRAEPRGFVKRDGELHVFSYGPMSISTVGEIRWPSWSVIAIAADGGVRNPVEDANVPMMAGGETIGFISPDHSSFGVRGPAQNLDTRKGQPADAGLEVTWRWDSVKKKYVGKHRRFPLPAAPGPKPVTSSRPVK